MIYTSDHTMQEEGYFVQYEMKEDNSTFNQVFNVYSPDIEIEQ